MTKLKIFVLKGLVCLSCNIWLLYNIGWALSFEELQHILKSKSDLQWEAKDTGIREIFRLDENNSIPFGLKDDGYDVEGLIVEQVDKRLEQLPLNLDWRSYNDQIWVSPIRNQGMCGSCVAFATIAALESTIKIAVSKADLNLDLSEQYLFSLIGKCNSGAWYMSSIAALKNSGTPDESCFPYMSGRIGIDFESTLACKDVSLRAYKISEHKELYGKSAIKEALQKGPVVTRFDVYEDFLYYSSGIYKHVAGSKVGGHAVVIVGYDDTIGAWIVQNSWGSKWGENGFFRIVYDDVSGLGTQGYQMYVKDPELYVNVRNMYFLNVVKDTLSLEIETLAADIHPIKYYIVNPSNIDSHLEGVVNTGLNIIDLSSLSDGVYDISIIPLYGKAWYSSFIIAKERPNITIEIKPTFDIQKPVSKTIYFVAHIKYNSVPLNKLWFHIKNVEDGTIFKSVQISDNPGDAVKVGLNTTRYPNGKYLVWLSGNLDEFYVYGSPALTLYINN